MNDLRVPEPIGYVPPQVPWYMSLVQNTTLMQAASLFVGLVFFVSLVSFLVFFVITTNMTIKYLRSHDEVTKEKLIKRMRYMSMSLVGVVVAILFWLLVTIGPPLLASPTYRLM